MDSAVCMNASRRAEKGGDELFHKAALLGCKKLKLGERESFTSDARVEQKTVAKAISGE